MGEPRILYPLRPIAPTASKPAPVSGSVKITASPFQDILRREIGQVKFSQHAQKRLDSRNIRLDEEQMERLRSAVDKAAQKGARESLVLMDSQLAFVVSVSNRTVITAMDGQSIKDNIFTNIDSAVVV